MDDIDRWLNYSEFMGETKEAVKDIRSELVKLREGQVLLNKKLDIMTQRLTLQSIKTGVIAGVLGMFSGFIISIVFNVVA